MPRNNQIKEIQECTVERLLDEVVHAAEPVVLRGLIADWRLVQEAQKSTTDADRYLRHHYNGAPVLAYIGDAKNEGRIFYDDTMQGFNFRREKMRLDAALDAIQLAANTRHPPTYYIGSTAVDGCLPELRAENDLSLHHLSPLVSIWLGNKTRVAAHYDTPDNVACVAVGKRRFTLFEPEQLHNLYVGPIDFTPAGQAISLVDFNKPDFKKYPRFKEALKHAQYAELDAGDAIYVPSMWWHHVEGLDDFNVLINYWWRQAPAFMGSPLGALNHALLSIRDLPAEQRRVWKYFFAHYVFDSDDDISAHIPAERRGVLAPIDEVSAKRLRTNLLNQLNI